MKNIIIKSILAVIFAVVCIILADDLFSALIEPLTLVYIIAFGGLAAISVRSNKGKRSIWQTFSITSLLAIAPTLAINMIVTMFSGVPTDVNPDTLIAPVVIISAQSALYGLIASLVFSIIIFKKSNEDNL